MEDLPQEMIFGILNYLSYDDLMICELISINFNNLIYTLDDYISRKEKYFCNKKCPYINDIPTKLIEVCGMKILAKSPTLTGYYGYVMSINNRNLIAPIMRGYDICYRPFITFKLKNQTQALTFYQRHSNHTHDWRISCDIFFNTSQWPLGFSINENINEQSYDNIIRLIKTGFILIPNTSLVIQLDN